MAVPLSNWYLRHFNLPGLLEHVDWFNIMSYNIHGVWDAEMPSLGLYIQLHTNIIEIKSGIEMFHKNGIPSEKLVLGLAAYGCTWTLEDPMCSDSGCVFVAAGEPGPCTSMLGIMSNTEINNLINLGEYDKLEMDADSGSMILIMSGSQQISFNDVNTLSLKNSYAESMCMCKTMLWSIDMAEPGSNPPVPTQEIIRGIFFSEDQVCPQGYQHANQSINLNGDLNQDVGRKFIYTCLTWDSAFGDHPITGLRLQKDKNCGGAGWE